jgi:hypothetical protein
MSNTIKLSDVVDFIRHSNTTEIDILANEVTLRRNRKAMELKRELGVGSAVKFTSSKKRSPYTYTAVITDKRQTRATVRITGPAWGNYAVGSLVTVPFAMLAEA